MNRISSLLVATLVLIPAAWPPRLAVAQEADAAALAVEARVVQALGGRDGWEQARVFVFTWAPRANGQERGVRHHVWDRYTGRYRLEYTNADGDTVVSLFNGNTKQGRVWVGGQEVTDPDTRDPLLDRAHGTYINDTYWLVMPFKWRDPGVTLTSLGRIALEGREWDAVQLTFESVGRTPRNMYRAYVNPETDRMEMWDHYRDRDDTEPRIRTRWTDWQSFGPVTLAVAKPYLDRDAGIFFRDVAVYTEVDESLFAPPTP